MVKVKIQKKPELPSAGFQSLMTYTAANAIICPSTESDLLSDTAIKIRM